MMAKKFPRVESNRFVLWITVQNYFFIDLSIL